MGGRASIRGMRITVAHIVNMVANGMTSEEIVQGISRARGRRRSAGPPVRGLSQPRRDLSRSWLVRVKFLADMGVSLTTVPALRTDGHHAVHLRDDNLIRWPDVDIVEKARGEL